METAIEKRIMNSIPEWLRKVVEKPLFNKKNMTIRKLVQFSIVSGIGGLVLLGFTYLFTEFQGIWYMFSIVLAGGIAIIIKFVLNCLWTFGSSE